MSQLTERATARERNQKPTQPSLESALPLAPSAPPSESQTSDQPGVAGFADAQAEYQQPKQTKREREYTQFIAHQLGPIIVFVLWCIIHDWERAAWYAPNPDELGEMAPHVARLVPRKMPEAVHNAILRSGDYTPLAYVVGTYLDRIGVLDKIRPTWDNLLGGNRAATEPTRHSETIPPTNGHRPASDILDGVTGLGSQYTS